MTTSLSTRSTVAVSRRFSASRPPVATTTVQPSWLRRSRSDWQTPRSSSTTRRRMPLDRAGALRPEVGHLRPREVLPRRVLGALGELGELAHDPLDAPERGMDGVETLALDDEVRVRGHLGDVPLEQVQVVDDDLEGVVDLVREADRDLAEERQLVVAADLTQVLGEADRAGLRSLVVADDAARDRNGDAGAVLGDEDGLVVLGLSRRFAVAEPHGAHDLAGLREVGVEPGHVLPEHLLRRVAERAPCSVVVEDDGPRAVHGDDDVGRAREQLLEIGRRETGYGGHARTRGRMVGPGGTSVKAALAFVLLAGCFWRSYGRAVATHVEVLLGMARKGVDLVANARARAAGRPPGSLLAFEALLVRYRSFLDALDRVRRQQSGAAAGRTLQAPLAAVEAAGEAVRAS